MRIGKKLGQYFARVTEKRLPEALLKPLGREAQPALAEKARTRYLEERFGFGVALPGRLLLEFFLESGSASAIKADRWARVSAITVFS